MTKRQEVGTVATVLVGIAGIVMVVLGIYTMQQTDRPYRDVPGGDIERGRSALVKYNCGSCHKISGVDGANGTRGQPLGGLALRTDIVGALPNTPQDVVRWIRNPKAFYPQTAMPDSSVSEQDALDMVAFLYTLPP